MENKQKIFEDLYSNRVPERVPIETPLSFEAVLQYGDINVAKSQWAPSMIAPAVKEICDRLHSDRIPITRPSRTASMYKFMGSKSFVFSSADIMQHPEVSSLSADDYDDFIKCPYDCMVEKAFPRFNSNIDYKNHPEQAMLTLTKALAASKADAAEYGAATAPIFAQYDYFKGFPGGASVVPVDYISDILRSFSGISLDLRRNRNKVIDAAEAVLPLLYKMGYPAVVTPYSRVSYWTHMPTFMRQKDVEEVWWPTFYKMAVNYACDGIGILPWCEDDWTRFIDLAEDLPTNSMLRFEHGDAKLLKDRLGKKHILAGLYLLGSIKTKSKQECIDEAKALLDIMAPGGRYEFMMDKVIMTINKEEFDKLCAVVDFVHEYGKYENAGEKAGLDFHKEDYSPLPMRKFESKYYTDWSKVEGISPECAKKMQKNEDEVFQFFTAFFK